MTGHTSDELIGTDGGTGHERGTDAESATRTPNVHGDVVQDSPGNPDMGVEDDNGGNGNLTGEERPIQDDL
ncbi:hypothetical protein [Deinococcus sp.]|uniref:hypothetical protein n=1 Tax=Deinococcus sp. TaxID=47478 RepID=UPI003C7C8CF6